MIGHINQNYDVRANDSSKLSKNPMTYSLNQTDVVKVDVCMFANISLLATV